MEDDSLLTGLAVWVKVGPAFGESRMADLREVIADAWAEKESQMYPQG